MSPTTTRRAYAHPSITHAPPLRTARQGRQAAYLLMTARERLEAIAADESADPGLRNAARVRLAATDRRAKSAAQRATRERALARGPVRRYRVNGVWKLDRRIADFDAEGDVINGWSDRC